MTVSEIINNNILIATYLGYQYTSFDNLEEWEKLLYPNGKFFIPSTNTHSTWTFRGRKNQIVDTLRYEDPKDMQYDNSWNWLMIVVDFMNNKGYSFEFKPGKEYTLANKEKGVHFSIFFSDDPISAVYSLICTYLNNSNWI